MVSRRSRSPDRWITRVAGDPFEALTIYATVSGFRWDEPQPHVFRSENLGQSWVDISSNLPELPMNCIALDPEVPGRIFVGSDAGLFYTENGGDEWVSLSNGIPVIANLTSDLGMHLQDGIEGFVSEDCSAEAFSKALERALSLSEVALVRMRKAAFSRAQSSFDYRRYSGALTELLDVSC